MNNRKDIMNMKFKINIILLFLSFNYCLGFTLETNNKNYPMNTNEYPIKLDRNNVIVKMTVLYDNYIYSPGTEAEWGFSCLIETGDKTILFDTGGDGDVLLHNIKELEVDISEVDIIVISHNHWDHTGGLVSVLESNNKAIVYLLESFPQEFISNIKEFDNEVILVNEPIELCSGVNSTGNLSGPINEQSLIVQTNKGPVLITGCSHPGIISIVEKAEELSGENVYLVFGGFHLMRLPDNAIDNIIDDFRKLGVKKCGATHCTGDNQIERFKDGYKEDYIEIGTGKVLEF